MVYLELLDIANVSMVTMEKHVETNAQVEAAIHVLVKEYVIQYLANANVT
jgi:hypothetical protein